MRPYSTGQDNIAKMIDDLIEASGNGEHDDLVREMIVSAIKLYHDRADRGDVKLINAAVKEMRYSTLVFSRYRDVPKVTVFGSARTKKGELNYQLAYDFAHTMVHQRGWMVVTGAGPGIMEAGNEGAGADHSFGVNIRLPFEDSANPYLDAERIINFKYFFTRKVGFIKESHAFALFPGGFGTMDETFELLTLVQTGKSDLHPIVLLESEGTGYWETFNDFVREDLLGKGLISQHDLSIYKTTNSVEEAADEICHFYANYQSQRYVDGRQDRGDRSDACRGEGSRLTRSRPDRASLQPTRLRTAPAVGRCPQRTRRAETGRASATDVQHLILPIARARKVSAPRADSPKPAFRLWAPTHCTIL